MRYLLAFLFLCIVSASNAAESATPSAEKVSMEQFDGRRKKRINKKRKRKCSQFGRRIYAG
jgi:hypothetical protein